MPQLPTVFHHQDAQSSLCAYYSLVHFLRGGINQEVFVSQAANAYMDSLGIDREMAKEIVMGGNDPAIVAKLLGDRAEETKKLNVNDTNYYSRVLIALRKRAHFITILKGKDGTWWNYDSLQSEPSVIEDVPGFLSDNPGQNYFVGK